MKYKALVTEKSTGTRTYIEAEAKSKQDFIKQMGYNGHSVWYGLVEEPEVYDWILDNTNADPENWNAYRQMAMAAKSQEETEIDAKEEDLRYVKSEIERMKSVVGLSEAGKARWFKMQSLKIKLEREIEAARVTPMWSPSKEDF